MKMDETTSLVTRSHFAHICVEIDISKSLISKFRLKLRVRKVEYEGIHMVCFTCGMYGHMKENCLVHLTPPPVDSTKTDQNDGTNSSQSNEKLGNPGMIEDEAVNPEVVDNYGPWIIAKWKERRPHVSKLNRQRKVPILRWESPT